MYRSRTHLFHEAKSDESRVKPANAGHVWGVAKPLAPEEIRLSDRVIVLHQIEEMPSFFWETDPTMRPVDRVIRVTRIPEMVEPPLKVTTVCLPIVGAETWKGETRLFDVRLVQLARVQRAFAKTIWKGLRKSQDAKTPTTF